MNAAASDAPIPPAVIRYIKDPLPEKFTEEIFEDLHYVLDQYLVEFARGNGASAADEKIVEDWEANHRDRIEQKQAQLKKDFGATLPWAFVASNVKMEYLAENEHRYFKTRSVPDDVIEVVQEFVEIVTFRDEFDE